MKKNGKISTITSPGHGKYTGETKGFIRHGQGTYTLEGTNNRYTGNWVDGEMHGKGTKIYENGAKYVGMFKDGLEHGAGTVTGPDGFTYEGEFAYGRPVGAEELTEDQKLLNPDPRESIKPDPKAEKWADRNVWFGSDEIMTLASFSIHRKLVDKGFDLSSDEYYHEIDNRIRAEFPHLKENTWETIAKSNYID